MHATHAVWLIHERRSIMTRQFPDDYLGNRATYSKSVVGSLTFLEVKLSVVKQLLLARYAHPI